MKFEKRKDFNLGDNVFISTQCQIYWDPLRSPLTHQNAWTVVEELQSFRASSGHLLG